MKIIQSLNNHYAYNELIKEYCQQAKENPFDTYLWICEHPYEVEKMFFQYTNHLVNIEIMTYSSYLKQLQIQYHLTNHSLISTTMFTYHLRNILIEEGLSCFDASLPYPLIDKFIPLMKDYEMNMIEYSDDTQPKLKDFIHLYHSLKERMDNHEHLTMESMFDECVFKEDSHIHIFIDATHLYQAKRQELLKKLDKAYDVTLFYTHSNDSRSFNKPLDQFTQNAITLDKNTHMSENLFAQNPKKSLEQYPYTYFVEGTPLSEVKRVVHTIYQKIVDEKLHFEDFMIVYPDSTYVPLLIQTLDSLHLPHNLPYTTSCMYEAGYRYILNSIQESSLSHFQDIFNVINQEKLDKEYIDYFHEIRSMDKEITSTEFQDFFVYTYNKNKQSVNSSADCIQVCDIQNAFSFVPKHVYFLGMNETVFPRLIKDTALLLDEDIQTLREMHISTPFNTTEQLGMHHNDIFKALNQPMLSLNISYPEQSLSGTTLLQSSLFKQLCAMFDFKELPKNTFLALDDYYLQGGLIEEKQVINQNIQSFKQNRNQPMPLPESVTEHLYSPYLSVSQIETYNKCPFLYFIQYGLGIYPINDYTLQPNELGSLVHYVLSILVDQEGDIDSLVEEYLNNNEILASKIKATAINQYFIKQLKKDLKLTLTVLKRQMKISTFQIVDKERKVEKDIEHLHFKGFVDRIDQLENYISIIDYKSSAKDIDLNLAMQGFNIQMLLYLKMVTEIEDKDPGAVLYFNTKKRILNVDQDIKEEIDESDFYKQYRFNGYIIDDEKHTVIKGYDPYFDKRSDIINATYVKTRNEYKGSLLSKEQLDILLEKIEEHILKLYDEMIHGNIAITPKGSDQNATHMLVNPCHYCPNHSICGFDVFYNDYNLVEFLDVENILGGEEDAV